MTSYEFALRLNREVADDELDALYEVGCGDAGIETGPLGAVADFDREASSLAQAIASAVRDIEKVPGLRAVGVRCDTMVNLQGIAQRAGVTREAVRLWATGKRGPGGFPRPTLISAGGEQIWDWLEVENWLELRQERGQGTGTNCERIGLAGSSDRMWRRQGVIPWPNLRADQRFGARTLRIAVR